MQDITGWGDNDRGVSYTFGGDVVHSFLQKLDLSLIARAHQVRLYHTCPYTLHPYNQDTQLLLITLKG